MNPQDIDNRFAYHAPDEAKRDEHARVRGLCGNLAFCLEELLPDSREKSLAITHLEETMMWANAAIARNS